MIPRLYLVLQDTCNLITKWAVPTELLSSAIEVMILGVRVG